MDLTNPTQPKTDVTNPMQLLLQEKDAVIASLRAEVAQLKQAERKLWVAVAHLQAAAGEANGWATGGAMPDNDEGGYDSFNTRRDKADESLDGVVGLMSE